MYRPPISSLAPYMYESWYDEIDYDYAYQWFRSHTPIVSGGCSTVRSGNLIGRNLDWIYSESAEFVVHTDGVVGVANAIPGLTDAFVKSGADDEIYKIVPFMLSDGMNKYGLVVSTLVVPTDKGDNSVVRPLDRSTRMMCTLMLPRYALDNFKTARGAVYYFSSNVSLYHPKTLQDQHYDQHFVFADELGTYCMEFVDGRYVITNISNKPYVTNFHLHGVEFNEDGSVNTPASGKASDNKITPNGSGLERYNLINYAVNHERFTFEEQDIPGLMKSLAYTRAYQSSSNPAVPRWDTEFVGTGLTADSPSSDFDYIQSEAARIYTNRSRILGETWQTVHSAIYDVQDKKVVLYSQENYDTQWEVSVMANQVHIQHLRGNTSKNNTFTGADGEITVDSQLHTLRVHDGVKEGGYELVNTSSAQTVTGAKTFTTSPQVPTAAAEDSSTKAASTAFVQGEIAREIGELGDDFVHKTGDENVDGTKTFTSTPEVKHTTHARGEVPAKAQYPFLIHAQDKNGNPLCAIYETFTQDMDNSISMLVYKGSDTTNTFSALKLGYKPDGTVYTQAPTPPLADNSRQIATTAWIRSVFPNTNGFKTLSNGAIEVDFSQMDAATINNIRKQMGVKIPLTAAKTFYVNGSTGSDTLDDGRGESSGKPFKTIQACVNYVCDYYDMSRFRATITVANGTYNEQVSLGDFSRSTGSISLRATNVGNVTISYNVPAGGALVCSGGAWVVYGINLSKNFNLSSVSAGTYRPYVTSISGSGTIEFSECAFSINATGTKASGVVIPSSALLYCDSNCTITKCSFTMPTSYNTVAAPTSSYCIWCTSPSAYLIISGSNSAVVQNTVNTPGVNAAFIRVVGGSVQVQGSTTYGGVFVGTSGGSRYSVVNGGHVSVGSQTYFPGATAGAVEASTYSWYK